MAFCELSYKATGESPSVCQPLTMIQNSPIDHCVLCPFEGKLPCVISEIALASRERYGPHEEYPPVIKAVLLSTKIYMSSSGIVWKKVRI